MIGYGSDARDAHLGLVELAAAVCRPAAPACAECPLGGICRSSQADAQRESFLF
jgi:DNA (cytosine-5)-methyltransferase 1